MSYLVRNPKDRFSHNEAQMYGLVQLARLEWCKWVKMRMLVIPPFG